MNEKETIALQAYSKGSTCSQAVIAAYASDLGLTKEQAYRLTEGFGSGFGGEQEVCGAFAAATMVISYLASDGNDIGKTKHDTYAYVKDAANSYKDKFNSIRCIEIMNGNKPRPLGCGEKVREAVKLVEEYINKNNI